MVLVGALAWAVDRETDGISPPPSTSTSTTVLPTTTTVVATTTTTDVVVPPLVELWRYDTNGTHAEGVTSDGTLVFGATRSGRIYALDPARGTPVWSVETGLDVEVAPVPGTGVVVLTGDDDSGGFLVALDSVTGDERWRTALPTTAAVARPTVLGASVYLSLTDLVAFDVATGVERWRRFDGPSSTEPFPASDIVTDGRMLFLAVEVWDGGTNYHKEIRAIDPATGIDLWAVLAGRALPEPRIFDGVVAFFVADAVGAAAQLVAVDPGNGQELWRSRPLDAFGVPAAAGGGIVVQQTTSLVAVDTLSGEPRWRCRRWHTRRRRPAPTACSTSTSSSRRSTRPRVMSSPGASSTRSSITHRRSPATCCCSRTRSAP